MKKIAIIGTAPASRAVAPFSDMSWDIWACSAGNQNMLSRVTCWFELHAMVEMRAQENVGWSAPYFQWLKAQGFPTYMQEPNDEVPRSIIFPHKKLIEHFGTRNWFTSTPAWMMAFAIYQMTAGDELGIFGVDMAAPQEYYTMQKGGLIYWIERAQALGIKVTVPMESCLGMPTPLYGYNEASRFGRRMNVMTRLTADSVAQLQQQHTNIAQQIAFHQGAAEVQAYITRTMVDGFADAELDIADMTKVVSWKAAALWPAEGKGTTFQLDKSGVLVPVKANGRADPEAAAADIPVHEPFKPDEEDRAP